MNIMMKLTLRHMKTNIKRTVVTIFGIVASTALITAMLVGIYSTFAFVADVSLDVDGNWHAIYKNVSEVQYRQLLQDDRLETVGLSDADNEITGFRIDGGSRERFRIGNIYHGDSANLQQLVTCEYNGRLPENPDEIAVEESFLRDNALDLQPGDTLTFYQGNRYIYEGDQLVYLAGEYRSYEKFNTLSEDTCVITAILYDNEPTASFTILRGMETSVLPDTNKVYVSLKKPDYNAIKNLKDIANEYGLTIDSFNTEYLICIFAFREAGTGIISMFRLMAFALAIIIAISVILIYNAFAMSLTERMKYLGMLASVGATKFQKRASVYYEGFLFGLVGIPVGLAVGIAGAAVTLRVVGAMICETNMIRGVKIGLDYIPVKLHPLVIVLVILFAGLTIFLSSFVPAIRASHATPVEALRQSNEIKLRTWKLKVFPLVKVIFGYEGELASKNIKRNGAKGVIITLSLAASLVVFLSIVYFMELFNQVNSYDIEIPFQVIASAALSENEQLKFDIQKLDGVEEIFVGEMITYDYYDKDEDGNVRETPNPSIMNPDYLTKYYKKLFEKEHCIWVVPVEDEAFCEICRRNQIDETAFFGDELRGVLLNNYNHEKSRKKVFNESILGQKLFYDQAEGNPPAVVIEDFVEWDDSIEEYKLSPKGSISVYVPVSIFHREYVKNINEADLVCTYGIKCEDHEAVYRKIRDVLEFDGYHNTFCSDIQEELQVMLAVLSIMKTIMYGFTILVMMIVIANIMNTISTGVMLRRKEFAMFKSVGLTEHGFKKMLFLETFLYGIRAVLLGIPVSLILSCLMFRSLASSSAVFEINWGVYLLAIVGTFAVVAVGMLLSTSQIQHDSVIEVLKEDIC